MNALSNVLTTFQMQSTIMWKLIESMATLSEKQGRTAAQTWARAAARCPNTPDPLFLTRTNPNP